MKNENIIDKEFQTKAVLSNYFNLLKSEAGKNTFCEMVRRGKPTQFTKLGLPACWFMK
ncbi:MAG: hypothetical protein WCW17_02805 [Patescibacteria group bacterium]|jgi:hypothetical protein